MTQKEEYGYLMAEEFLEEAVRRIYKKRDKHQTDIDDALSVIADLELEIQTKFKEAGV